MNMPNLHAIAEMLTRQMAVSLVLGTMVAMIAALTTQLVRRMTASTRFAIWFAALICIALLPIIGGWSGRVVEYSLPQSDHSVITLPGSWALYAFGAWALIACWLLLRIAVSLRQLWAQRRQWVPVNQADLDPQLQKTLRNRQSGALDLYTSKLVSVPAAIGLFKPAIVIPDWVMKEMSPDELNQILLHELAHLNRWDGWTNLAQRIIKAVFFFHPAIWWIEKKIVLEREMACDNFVIEQAGSARAYAECLAHLAEKSFVRRGLALAQAALGKVRQTSFRVAQILSEGRATHNVRNWKPAVSLVAGFTMVCAFCSPVASHLISFEAPASVAVARQTTVAPLGGVRAAQQTEVASGIPVAVTPVKLTLPPRQNRFSHPTLKATSQTEGNRRVTNLVHTTAARSNKLPVIQTMYVFIEGAAADSSAPSYEIQVWHLTVMRLNSAPLLVPPKQT